MQSLDKLTDKELSRGLRSGVVLILFCILGTAFATWVTYEGRHLNASATTLSSQTQVPNPQKVALLTEDFSIAAPTLIERSGKLARNSTPVKLLKELGADSSDASSALQAIYSNNLADPRKLQAGMPISAHFDPDDGQLVAVSLRLATEQSVLSKRLANGEFFATDLNVKLTRTYRRVNELISTSLYEAGINAGLKDKQVADFAQIFAFDVDFQREVRVGDTFEVLYEAYVDERGNQIRSGEVIFAAFNGQTTKRDYYLHTPEDDNVSDYFTSEGKAATRFLMKTPINGARLSSSFGRRRHPISGYSRLHKGTDFAARSGTPVMAAGNGVVERSSRYGGYGKYVRLQHANGYETAYAHLSRYGRGIRSGRRVRQGDIIGYVGSTGASTGPHLHYEVLINGKHVNAMSLKLPTGRTLEGDLLESFDKTRLETDALRGSLGAEIEIATLTPVSSTQLR